MDGTVWFVSHKLNQRVLDMHQLAAILHTCPLLIAPTRFDCGA